VVNPVADTWAIDFAIDDARFPQHFEMLRDGGLCQGQMIDNFAADTGFSLHKETDDSHASRMCERLCEAGEFGGPFEIRHWELFLPTAALVPT